MTNRRSRLLRKKIAITAGFCLIALASSDSLLTLADARGASWVVPALMWMVAILVAFSQFMPSASKWAFSAIAVAYFLAAISSAWFVLAGSSYQTFYWALPVLMAMMAAVFGAGAVRLNQRTSMTRSAAHQPQISLGASSSLSNQ
jgi:hypothetical protein